MFGKLEDRPFAYVKMTTKFDCRKKILHDSITITTTTTTIALKIFDCRKKIVHYSITETTINLKILAIDGIDS